MNPQKGQFIQIRFNNGTYFDAIVEEWTDQKSVLKLKDADDIVVIQKTLQDVLLVKIFDANKTTDKPTPNVQDPSIIDPQYKSDIDKEFEDIRSQAKNSENLAKMADLKDKLNKMEREEFSKKMKSHTASGLREINYGIPRNIPISSSAQHTGEKTEPPDPEFYSELRGLFSKKD